MKILQFVFIFFLSVASVLAQQTAFSDVEVRFPAGKNNLLINKSATLVLDDTARHLIVKSGDRPLDVAYGDVQKIIVEVNTLGHKAGFGASMLGLASGGILFGGAIATALDKPFDNDHFVYIEYKASDGQIQPYLLNVGKSNVPQVLKALQTNFADRVIVPDFPEKGEKIDPAQVQAAKAEAKSSPEKVKTWRFKCVPTAARRPLPELRPDKALVLVVSPATIMRQTPAEKRGGADFIFSNGEPLSVNDAGTYSFFYLEPGEYFLLSVPSDQVGLRMKLEAGKDYYLTQTLYAKGIITKSFLTRHSKELVLYEARGSLYSDWSVEQK